MEFVDLKAQQDSIRDSLDSRIARVLEHGKYIMGPEVFELEQKLAEYVGVRHCISASSGTDTLLMALMAIGLQPGDEIVTTAFTFVATAEVIELAGGTPVFVDITPDTYNLDPTLLGSAITSKTKAIMPVGIFGQCAAMDEICAIAKRHGLPVIEDAAQCFGATHNGQKSCGLSTIGSTSFFPSKPLGCYGDGGALFTDDDDYANALRQIRVHGQEKRYFHTRLGLNGRLDTIQAAVLLSKFEIFEDEVRRRRAIGQRYSELFSDTGIVTPFIAPNNTSVYAQYSIQVADRARVIEQLSKSDVPTAIHYPVPLHLQPAYSNSCKFTDLSVSESVSSKIMSLPMGPYLSERDQNKVVQCVLESMRL